MTNGLKDMLLIYQDICNEIEYYEILLEEMEREYKINKSLMFVNPRNFGEGYVPIPLDVAVDNADKIIERYKKIEKLLSIKKRMKKSAEEQLNKFKGIDHQVAYLRFVKGLTLSEIAAELNYSYDWIKKVSSRISVHLECTDI